MNNPNAAENSTTQPPDSRLRRFATWYKAQPAADFLLAMQPLGTLATALALLVAVIALIATFSQIRESRTVREATLFVLAMERMEVARRKDSGKSATFRRKNGSWWCSHGWKQLSARAGQIPVLERMVLLRISLRDIIARDVNLVVTRSRRDRKELRGIHLGSGDLSRADLRNTNLRNALLSGAMLTGAELDGSCLRDAILINSHLNGADLEKSDLGHADLSNADLTGADLYQVNFSNVTFTGATLTNADITGADFSRAKGLTQAQLDSACAELDEPPVRLPKANDTRLTWKPKECE